MSKLDILGSLKEESEKNIKGSPLSSKHEEELDFDSYIFSGSVSNKKKDESPKENMGQDEKFFSSFEEKKPSKKNRIAGLVGDKKDSKTPIISNEIVEDEKYKYSSSVSKDVKEHFNESDQKSYVEDSNEKNESNISKTPVLTEGVEPKKSRFESVFEEKEEIPESLKNMKPTNDKEPILKKPGRKRNTPIISNKTTEKEDIIMPKNEFSPLEKKIVKKLLDRAKNSIEVTKDDLVDQEDINYYFDKLKEMMDNA